MPLNAPRRDRLVAVVVAIYRQTLGFGFIPFNEPSYVYRDSAVLAGLTRDGFRREWTTFYASN